MTGNTSRIRNNMLCFPKICIFEKNYNFTEKKEVFSCDFKIFDDSIGCAAKFHDNEIYFKYIYIC